MFADLSTTGCDFRGTVTCCGRRHQIEVVDGQLVLGNHDVESERVLTALGGDPPKCLELLSIWQAPWSINDIQLLNGNVTLSPASTLEWGNGRIPNATARKLSRDRPVPWWFRTMLGIRIGFELRDQAPKRSDEQLASLIRRSALPTQETDIVCWPANQVGSAFFGWSDGRATSVAFYDQSWRAKGSTGLAIEEGFLVLYASPNRPGLRGVISWEQFGDGFLANVRWGPAGTRPPLHAIT